MNKRSLQILMTLLTAVMFSTSASAHTGQLATPGFVNGLLHPLLGVDHLLTLYAIGLWAVLKGGREMMLLPMSFLLGMLAGAGVCFSGLELPGMEVLVIMSLLICALLMLSKTHFSAILSCLLVLLFGLGHGFVHAAEISSQAQMINYVSGFMLTSGMLLAMGLLTALLSESAVFKLRTLLGWLCAFAGMTLLAGI